MTQQSKERLLGMLLLLAIAAIFLPMLLDGQGVRQGRLQAVLPPAPAAVEIVHYQPQYKPHLDTDELAEPKPATARPLSPPPAPLANEASSSKKANTLVPELVVNTSLGTEPPVLDQQGVPVGWTLQLASFKDRDNAVSLQQNLIQRGYQAYIGDKGDLTKVFVGPDLQKSVMDGIKEELKRDLKLDGLVLRFRP